MFKKGTLRDLRGPGTAAGSESQAVGPDTEKLRDPYCDSR